MNKQDIPTMIKEKRLFLTKEMGLNGQELEEALVNLFMQDFFFGEITKNELDEIADAMDVQINIVC